VPLFSGLLVDLSFSFSFLSVVLTGSALLDKIKHAVGRTYVSDGVLQMGGKHSYSCL